MLRNTLWLWSVLLLASASLAGTADSHRTGTASWYGEEHRGRLMANGKKFDPDKLTAASWHYPLGTKVRVRLQTPAHPPRSVRVTITDRGPSPDLVRQGRIIDLTHAAFSRLATPDLGLVQVTVCPIK